MAQVLRFVLILAVTFGAAIAPGVSPANVPDTAMDQMNTAETAQEPCGGCVSSRYAGDMPCESGRPLSCGPGGTAGVVARTPWARLTMSCGVIFPGAEPLILLGIDPPFDPFPPKTPV